MTDFPALNEDLLPAASGSAGQPPRFLLLYGSTRPQSLTHRVCEETSRLLQRLGGEVRIFDTAAFPLPDTAPPDHPKCEELRQLFAWSDGQFWCSPENYGAPSAVMKAMLEAVPPVVDGAPTFSGKPLAVAQVTGAVPSFNTTSGLAGIGRWMGMFVTSTQLCINKVQEEFDESGRMKPSPVYDRLVDLAEELFKLTALLRDHRAQLLDRYSVRLQKR